MSKYCKCFISNKTKYILETNQNSDSLLYYYDKIHNDRTNNMREFSQSEYVNTICQVKQLKQKLLGK
jgi:hypothetical protein